MATGEIATIFLSVVTVGLMALGLWRELRRDGQADDKERETLQLEKLRLEIRLEQKQARIDALEERVEELEEANASLRVENTQQHGARFEAARDVNLVNLGENAKASQIAAGDTIEQSKESGG